MDRSNPSTSSIFNNERSFLWLHADQLPFDLTVTRLPSSCYWTRENHGESSSMCHEVTRLPVRHFSRHSKTVFLSTGINMCHESLLLPSIHEEEQEGPRIQINVYPVEGWWMERGNNFTWRCFRRLWKYESWRDDGCNERRWSRGKVWEAWAQRQRWVMSASLSWNGYFFFFSPDNFPFRMIVNICCYWTFKTCNFQSMRIYSGV